MTNPKERWKTQTTQPLGGAIYRQDSIWTWNIRVDDSRRDTSQEHLAH